MEYNRVDLIDKNLEKYFLDKELIILINGINKGKYIIKSVEKDHFKVVDEENVHRAIHYFRIYKNSFFTDESLNELFDNEISKKILDYEKYLDNNKDKIIEETNKIINEFEELLHTTYNVYKPYEFRIRRNRYIYVNIITTKSGNIHELIKDYIDSNDGEYSNINFEELFDKCPEELKEYNENSLGFTNIYYSMALYSTFVNPNIDYFGTSDDKVTEEEYERLYNNRTLTKEEINAYKEDDIYEFLKLGKKLYELKDKYGYYKYNRWRFHNYGCDSNGINANFINDNKTVIFITYRGPASKVIKSLSKMYPNEEFICSYLNLSRQELIKEVIKNKDIKTSKIHRFRRMLVNKYQLKLDYAVKYFDNGKLYITGVID